ncbi:MAG: hypothetical protein ACLRUZ_06525 [Faecalimonas sp.]
MKKKGKKGLAVTVTLTANEPVQSIEGWTLDETQTVLTKAVEW